LLYDLEPSQASFALCFKLLLMKLRLASEEFYRRSLLLGFSLRLVLALLNVLSGLGDPAGSNATTGLAIRVTGTHKPLHHDKV
jgi:hypothetical protein